MKEKDLDKQKLRTLRQLKAAGIDTRKKLDKLTGREMYEDTQLRSEMGNIFVLQDHLKMRKEYDWIMDGIDEEPAMRKEERNADDGRAEGRGIYTETYENAGY